MRATPSRSGGFTLLEMLVVLVLIGLIASLVGPRLFSRVDASKVQVAETQVRMLRGSVETFRLEVGRLPTEAEGLTVLFSAPTEERARARWRGPYLDEAVPDDPWGRPYRYSIPGPDGMGFALYSFGADGEPGGEGNDADVGFLPPR
jgi:general secretion pathway protein G